MSPVGIIGGMGPFAGAHFLNLFLTECSTLIREAGNKVTDQQFPPHYLSQLPVPDRTSALFGSSSDYKEILQMISQQIAGFRALDVKAVAIACNTAHAWHEALCAQHRDINIIHMGDVAARRVANCQETKVGLLATAGTVESGIYENSLSRYDIDCIAPNSLEVQLLMAGIYDGVKAGNYEMGRGCFVDAVVHMAKRTGTKCFLMACTEIPLVLVNADVPTTCVLHDPSQLAARELALIALKE